MPERPDAVENAFHRHAKMIEGICDVASRFATIAQDLYPQLITQDTLRMIQNRIDENVARLRATVS